MVGLVSLLPLFTVTGAGAQQEPPPMLPAFQVVLLVDESGSISDVDVQKEKEAVHTIVAGMMAHGSRVSVVGFGSSNGPGQVAARVACPPAMLDEPQSHDSFAQCVESSLHKRAPNEGDGTDHVAALQQALTFVKEGKPDEKKIVFLLTDGKLDVSDSPSWGDTAARRNSAAQDKVKEVLADLDSAGAQVWPLGFGHVDNTALAGFAKGKSCTPNEPAPRERVISTSAELFEAVAQAYTSASCVKFLPPKQVHLPQGGTAEITVDLPAVASDASIVVFKRDPRVQVEYRGPNDKPAQDSAEGAVPTAQGASTEWLRLTEPEPGPWKIRLSSAGVPAQDVAATVVYQAAVRASMTVSPPQPAAGQPVDIDMQVRARGHAIIDTQGLSFVTTLTGTGLSPQQPVKLTDDDHDGTFSGKLTVPDGASGDITFTGEVTGIGIGGDTRTYSTRVLSNAPPVRAQILFDTNRAAVAPGGTIPGSVLVTNNSGQPARLRLEIFEPSTGTMLTVDPAVVQAASGSSKTAFTLRFGADSAIGTSAATLRLVDDSNVVVTQRLFANEVAPEPGLGQKLFWLWVALAVLVAGALLFLFIRLRARSKASKVRGLKAQLLQSGFVKSELEPRDPNSKVLRFVLYEDFTGLQLQHAGPGEANAYEVRRDGPRISLTQPGQQPGQPVFLMPGERREIGPDLAVAVFDERGMVGPRETVGGPVKEVTFDPFGGPTSTGPSAGPAGPSADPYGDPFAGSGAPGPSAQPAPADPFASSYGGSSAGSAPPAPASAYPSAEYPTAAYPTSTYPAAGPGGPGMDRPDPYGQRDPFGGDPFGSSPSGDRQPVEDDPTWRSPAPPGNDPYNPFGR